jgi:type III pantothenate kinase
LGRGSYESVQSGVYYGLASLVEGMLRRFMKFLNWDSSSVSVVFTGGLGEKIMEECEIEGVYDPHLTFKGMVNYYKHLLKVFS